MKRLVFALVLIAAAYGQTGSWPTAATDQDLVVAKTGATSTLTAGINASTLTVTVADGSKFAQYSIIRIDDEYMQICSIATNTLTICSGTRGLVGSAASHLDGATVRDVVSEYHHNRMRIEIKAMQAKLLPVTSGTSAPGTCAANRELFVDRDASPNPTLHLCNATGDGWLTIAGGGGVTCAVGPTGALVEDADCEFDIDTAIVATLDGANDWTGANDFSGASKTSPFRIGAADPGTCDATAREMFYNTTSNVLKVCNSTNTWTTYSGSGGGNVNAGSTLTSNAPVIGAGSTDVSVGTRSGNTTEFATITGTKTTGKQLEFDASGNVKASTSDIGGSGSSQITVLDAVTYAAEVVGDGSNHKTYYTYTIAGGTLTTDDIIRGKCLFYRNGYANNPVLRWTLGNGGGPKITFYTEVAYLDLEFEYKVTGATSLAGGIWGNRGTTFIVNNADTDYYTAPTNFNVANDFTVKVESAASTIPAVDVAFRPISCKVELVRL